MRIFRFLRVILFVSAFAAIATISATAVSVGTVDASALRIRQSASTSSATVGMAYRGDSVIVLSTSGDWCKVSHNNNEGYMYKDYLTLSDSSDKDFGTGIVTTSVLNVRSGPGTDYAVSGQLSNNTVVNITGVKSSWYEISYGSLTGYVHPDYISIRQADAASRGDTAQSSGSAENISADTSSGELRQNLVNYAKNFIGTKYVYGGTSPSGFDCSGLVYYVYKQFGHTLGRTATAQYGNGTHISKSELQLGDLVFFSYYGGSSIGHVGIYVGGGSFIHSVKPGDTVRITSLSESYYTNNY